MSGHVTRRAPSGIGALTNKDHYREAALKRKIDNAYRNMSTTPSARRRRRQLRTAHRHERALIAQRRRPQSALTALAVGLFGVLVAIVFTATSSTVAAIVAALLFVDVHVLRRRRRLLREG